MSLMTILLVLAVLFCAGLAKATLGFGEALITMPLLTLLLGVQMASPLTALVMTSLTGILLLQSWQRVDLRSAWRVMVMAVIGIPFGVWGLRSLPPQWITLALGVLLVAVGLFYLARPTVSWIPGPRWGFLFGFFAGLMGGAVTAGGPPIVIFGTLRRLPPAEFRATLQGCFTPLNLFILLGHALAGLWTQPVLQLYAYSIPIILVSLWLGTRIHHAIPARWFERVVYVVLVALGVLMMGQSIV